MPIDSLPPNGHNLIVYEYWSGKEIGVDMHAFSLARLILNLHELVDRPLGRDSARSAEGLWLAGTDELTATTTSPKLGSVLLVRVDDRQSRRQLVHTRRIPSHHLL